jgi:uncharacterized protein YecT (DUF1311 family)
VNAVNPNKSISISWVRKLIQPAKRNNQSGGVLRAIISLLCLAHGLVFADEDPALVETAKRLRMPIEAVKQHYQSGCDSGKPSEQFICGSYGLTREDMELNRVYTTLAAELKDKEARSKLASAQHAWIMFRDKACLFEADGYSQSRDLSAVLVSCKATYTKARSEQLKVFLGCGELYGCPGNK